MTRREPIPALTGFRFLAASHVVLLHYLAPVIQTGPAWLLNVVSSGQAAVSLFYVLSGFVLAYSTTGDDGTLRGGRSRFWLARFARLYPVYALAALLYAPHAIAALLRADGLIGVLVDAVLTATMLQAWVPNRPLVWNAPGWSISVEVFFYLLFPFLCAPLLRLSRRSATALIAGMCALALAPRVAFVSLAYPDGLPADNFALPDVMFWTIMPLLRLPEFVIGICVARLVADAPVVRGGNLATLVTVGGIVALFAVMATPTLHFLVIWIALPAFAVLIALLARYRNRVTAALSLPWLVLLGEASYALYILQEPVHIWFRTIGKRVTGMAEADLIATPLFFVTFYAVLVVLSVTSFRFLETPARRWIVALAQPNRAKAAEPVAAHKTAIV